MSKHDTGSPTDVRTTTRRDMLRAAGLGSAALILAGCTKGGIDLFAPQQPSRAVVGPSGIVLDFSTDTDVLNYAYALEQLEAAYYTAALGSAGFAALSANEQEVLGDLQKHEVIHREFFKTVLGSAAIPTINFNTTTVGTLTASRAVLLSTSQLLEDTGVSAYNGAGKYLTSAANLLVAGKIVSVEARHAAAIRDIRDTTGRLFAGDDVVNSAGLDVKSEPSTVGAAVNSLNVIVGSIAIGTQPDASKKTADFNAPTPV